MTRNEDKETGAVHFSFTADEIKKIKLGAIALGVIFAASLGTAGYSLASMQSLKAQNQLQANQLDMAQQKMKELSDKTATIEKMSQDLTDMVRANNNGAAANMAGGSGQGGVGGASTVPDKARDVQPADHQNGKAEEEAADAGSMNSPGQLLSAMRKLNSRIDSQIKTLIVLREQIVSQTYGATAPLLSTKSDVPDMWPVHGTISSGFGFRSSPGGIGSTYHEGLDIAVDYGTPVEATASGTVTQAGWVDGYGYLVEIKHAGGLTTRYGHNSALLVNVGQTVEQGTTIALAGSTGNSTGPHCHYEVRVNGDAVDPTYFLPGNY